MSVVGGSHYEIRKGIYVGGMGGGGEDLSAKLMRIDLVFIFPCY